MIAGVGSLAGCSLLPFTALLEDRSKPCEELPLDIVVKGNEVQNLNPEGQSMPVEVRAYMLSRRDTFDALDFDAIWKRGDEALGSTLLGSLAFTVFPGEEKINPVGAPIKVAYVAMIGLFRRPDGDQWRSVVDIHGLAEKCRPGQLHFVLHTTIKDNRMVADGPQ